MNLDLVYMIPLYFGNDIIPKYIHFVFALLTAWLIWGYLRRRLGINYGLLGAVLFLSIPVIVKLSITVYVDLGVLFFSTASVLSLLKWIETDFQKKYILLSALSCGLAMGTKYNGLVLFAVLTLFVPFIYSRFSREKGNLFFKSAAQGLIFFLVSLVVFSPWMIRNYRWKANPIYPLYHKVFHAPKKVMEDLVNGEKYQAGTNGRKWEYLKQRRVLHGEKWWEIVLIPVRIFVQGRDGSPRYFDGKLNPFLLLLPIFGFWRSRQVPEKIRNEKKVLLAFALFFFLFAFFTNVIRIRYFSPILGSLVILAVFGVYNLFQMVRVSTRSLRLLGMGMVTLALGFFLLLNGDYLLDQFRYVKPLSYLSGRLSRDAYIDEYVYEYPVLRYINKKLPHDARILFIFMGQRGYYCNRDYILDDTALRNLVRESNSPEQVLEELKKERITHFLIRYDIFDKWVPDVLNIKEIGLLKEFMKNYAELLFAKWGYGVSRIKYDAF